jgi:hypothetical protein
MSQYQPPYVVCPPARCNGLGIAGFIVSLFGVISCGLLSPIGLLLSGIALFRSPRGFALAGLIIGLLGSLWAIVAFVVVGLTTMVAAAGIGAAVPYVKAGVGMDRLAQIVQTHKTADGTLPADLGSIPGIDRHALNDPWGHPFRFVRKGNNEFDITSDGPDGVQGTFDDISRHDWQSQDHHPRHTKRKPVEIN